MTPPRWRVTFRHARARLTIGVEVTAADEERAAVEAWYTLRETLEQLRREPLTLHDYDATSPRRTP